MNLTEILDDPWPLEDVTSKYPEVVAELKSEGKRMCKVFQATPTDLVFEWFEDGYWEIHHCLIDGKKVESGLALNKSPVSARFISTMFALAQQKVRKANGVKISATEDLIDNFYRIATAISKRKGFVVTDIRQSDQPYFTIRPRSVIESVLTIMNKGVK